jgi:hypothetical protein
MAKRREFANVLRELCATGGQVKAEFRAMLQNWGG